MARNYRLNDNNGLAASPSPRHILPSAGAILVGTQILHHELSDGGLG